MPRTTIQNRQTYETQIEMKLDFDGRGLSQISTGIGFFDHMLTLFAKHGQFDLEVNCKGDLEVDTHHVVEDIGIVLGQCLSEVLADKSGLKRYGMSYTPMDEALIRTVIDLSGRAYLVFNGDFTRERVGDFETEMVSEFFRAVATEAKMTLHIQQEYGENNHHIIEGMFKGFGRTLKDAGSFVAGVEGVMSTKGVL